jgi:chemotaxis signal transduction protein
VAATELHFDDGSSVLGSRIEEDTLAAVLSLRDSQSYHVTPFRPSPLFGGKHTYIYHAGIRAEGGSEPTVGGIGIVFNAEREFVDMLTGGVGEMPDTCAVYVRRNGLVISSTDPTCPAGSVLKGLEELLTLPRGQATSRVLLRDGNYTIVGCAASSGYREFKVSDGYSEDVLALSFRTYGAEVPGADDMARRMGTLISQDSTVSGGREVATFFVNANLFGMPAEEVLQALPASALSNMTSGGLSHCVGAVPRMQGDKVKGYVWAFDLGHMLFGTPTVINYNSQVLVVRSQGREYGLLVSDLQGVPAFPASAIMKLSQSPNGPRRLVSHVVQANEGKLLIQLLDSQCLLEVLLPDNTLDPSRTTVDTTVSAY